MAFEFASLRPPRAADAVGRRSASGHRYTHRDPRIRIISARPATRRERYPDGSLWTLVNLQLVKQGFASVATYPPDVKYVEAYLAAEQDARAGGIGLWGAEPTPKAKPKPTAMPTASNCHPSYDPCLPIVDDLDCPDVRAMGKAPVTVNGPDEYRLDRDRDDIGCE